MLFWWLGIETCNYLRHEASYPQFVYNVTCHLKFALPDLLKYESAKRNCNSDNCFIEGDNWGQILDNMNVLLKWFSN